MAQCRVGLSVTVDVEETGLWKDEYRRTYSIDNLSYIKDLEKIQKMFDKYVMLPTYFVDYAICTSKDALSLLRDIFKSGRCQIGAHMHPWCTPPFTEELSNKNSFFNNLPRDLQREKLKNLTGCIEATFGIRPVCFRSGRFGFSGEVARGLRDFGYLIDSSITPFCDWHDMTGPNFNCAPYKPYWIDAENIFREDKGGDLLEIPISNGFSWLNFEAGRNIFDKLARAPYNKFHIIGILGRLGIFSKILARPESESLSSLKLLARNYRELESPVWNIYFHSSSAAAGGNPYVKTNAQLNHFLNKLDMLFKWCFAEAGFRKITLLDMREMLLREKHKK